MSRSSRPVACRFEHVPAALLPSDPNMYWQLTEEEEKLIALLTEAYTVITQSALTKSNLKGDQVLSIINRMAADMVTFFTKVPDFCAMPPRDQAAALSDNAMTLFLLRNAFAASADLEDGSLMVGHVTRDQQLVQHLCQFQRSLRPILRDDLSTVAILHCAIVFDARAPGLLDRQAINRLQDKYMILMKHYVESQCSYLFCWHYEEAMLVLVQQCRSLAALVTQQFQGWKAVMDPLISTLRKPDAD